MTHRPEERGRFRTPLGFVVMGYKALLGLAELAAGTVLAIPGVDIVRIFHRLAAEELAEDPGDRFVALISRHLPSLLSHRATVAAILIALGLAKLVAVSGMWFGREWGRYLLAAIVIGLLPLDVRAAVLDPSVGRLLLVLVNAAVGLILVVGSARMGRLFARRRVSP
jgi:uncharacterized membrane protein